jgi:hypothetical protein
LPGGLVNSKLSASFNFDMKTGSRLQQDRDATRTRVAPRSHLRSSTIGINCTLLFVEKPDWLNAVRFLRCLHRRVVRSQKQWPAQPRSLEWPDDKSRARFPFAAPDVLNLRSLSTAPGSIDVTRILSPISWRSPSKITRTANREPRTANREPGA